MSVVLKAHLRLKDSGIPWLGQIPDYWDVRRGKELFECIDIRSKNGDEELLTVSSDRGVVPRSSAKVTMFKAESYAGYKLCWPGDLVINSLWAWGRGLGVSRHYGIVSSAYGVYRLRPPHKDYSGYIHELVRSTPFNWELHVRSKGIWISRLQLTDDAFLGAPFPLPPVDEQAAIVRFLDHANRQIDRAIRTKKQLIALLNEQKQAVIHQAVTRGLDSSVHLKPSGVPWLGDIPKHWEVRRVKSCLIDVRSGFWGEDPVPENKSDQIICVRVADFDMQNLKVGTKKLTLRAVEESARTPRLLQIGDILMEKSGGGEAEPVGRVIIFDLLQPAISSNFIIRLRPDKFIIQPEFLLQVLSDMQKTRRNSPWIKQTTGIQNLDEKGYLSLPIAVPPLKDQTSLLAILTRKIEPVTNTILRIEREIGLLREYRTRLAADVVTGKIDVREIAAHLPNEPEDRAVVDEGGISSDDGVNDEEDLVLAEAEQEME